ncbi:hypothetical protein [Jannaschia sp. LMIT008]|uniref:hypothetical protein n=1 Tax=Jannaschia maritima TaxID=3032585 RepID=UPI002810E2A4|nr:hypothetical protein [Jannaschia sp. LMIT008]
MRAEQDRVDRLLRLRLTRLQGAEADLGAAVRAERAATMRVAAAEGSVGAFEMRMAELNRRIYARLLTGGGRGAARFEVADQAFDTAMSDVQGARAAVEQACQARDAAANRLVQEAARHRATAAKAEAAREVAEAEAKCARRACARRESAAFEELAPRGPR